MTTQRTFVNASTPISACMRSCAGNQASWMHAGECVSAATEMRSGPAAFGNGYSAQFGDQLQSAGVLALGGNTARGAANGNSKRARWRYDSMGVLH
jgi:hypothetical protein